MSCECIRKYNTDASEKSVKSIHQIDSRILFAIWHPFYKRKLLFEVAIEKIRDVKRKNVRTHRSHASQLHVTFHSDSR